MAAMDSPVLELKIVSASDLKKPGPFSSALQPYVVAAISGTGAASPAHRTPVDTAGGRNPTWNHSLALPLPGGGSVSNSLSLRLQILSRRGLAADKLIGEVCVPLLELLRSSTPGKFISYQVKRPSGRSKGVLTFSYKFTGKVPVASAAAAEPAIAYSAATPGTSTAYPPQNFYPPPSPILSSAAAATKPAIAYSTVTPGTSTAYPPQNIYPPPSPIPSAPPQAAYPPPPAAAPVASYGYPVQGGYGYGSYGYGYPGGQTGYGYGYEYNGPVVQPNKNKKSSGLGLGAGLLGGALAGFLVGDLVSDGGFFC